MIDLPALLFEADRALGELVAGKVTPEAVARLAGALHELEQAAGLTRKK